MSLGDREGHLKIFHVLFPIYIELKEKKEGKGKSVMQGSKGIRQLSINQCISPMMIHKTTFCKITIAVVKILDTQLNEPTNQNSSNVPKVVKPTNKKTLI